MNFRLDWFKSTFIFSFFILFLIVGTTGVFAVPVDPGDVTSLVDVTFSSEVYMGKTYIYHATAKNATGNVVVGQQCHLNVCEASSPTVCSEFMEIRPMCRDSDNIPTSFADSCFYITGTGGRVGFDVFLDPLIYNPNTDYTFTVECDQISVSKTATVMGVNTHGKCNVSAIKIHDGTDGAPDFFDESPNRFDNLIVPFELESFNTNCNGKAVLYKVRKSIGESYVDATAFTEHVVDLNGTATILIPLDASFVADGKYQVVISSDNATDSAEFVVLIPRDPFSPADIDFFWQPVFVAMVIIFLIVGISAIMFWRGVKQW